MKVVVDALGAPGKSGGMQLVAREFIESWTETHPDDQLLVIGYDWTRTFASPNLRVVVLPDGFAFRTLGQWLLTGLVARAWRADALISASPVVSPLFPARRRFCIVFDWRHLRRPEEFGRLQQTYRRGWVWSIERAAVAFQISEKTDAETRRLSPRTNSQLVSLGRDNARRWAHAPVRSGGEPFVVTYGHFNNKRADLVLRAVGLLQSRVDHLRLVVLGARGENAQYLRELAAELRITDSVDLPGFVDDAAYATLISQASVIVLASTDEGFGLPVTDANYLGIPCVVTSDSGLSEIHPGRVLVADPGPNELAAVIATGLAAERRSWQDESEGWHAYVNTVRSSIEAHVNLPATRRRLPGA